MVLAGTIAFRKLFDGTRGDSKLTDEEMMLLGARIRAYHMTGSMGPLAIAVTTEYAHGLARLPGAAAVAERPMRVFEDIRLERRWLEAEPPLHS